MGRIRKLSDDLANQIAAGEVVERPSSVVKELLENSLDAGATRVVIDIDEGGTSLIRITDDGEGMDASDAMLCLARHATSKIANADDLLALTTFGFRGEALPSIASVSRLSVRTRMRGVAEGLLVEAGNPPTPIGCAEGTSIEVRDLFYNVPARLKFLKATATESAHVSDVVLGAALARPDVTFVLNRDGRMVREHLRVASRIERAKNALAAEKLVHCEASRGNLRVEAMLAAPERARAGATGLSLLVNDRPVRDRMLARAVAQAYGSVLESGRYPVGVVWLDVPPEIVDVNVHPQKAEVRFADARAVFDAITRELHARLATAFGAGVIGPHPYAGARNAAPTLRTLQDAALEARARTPSEPELLPQANLFTGAAQSESPFGERAHYSSLRYVAQLRGMFLVCEGEDALYILDQHAAAERLTFDRLRKARADSAIAMQRLLVPEVVEIPAAEIAMLEENAAEVEQLGIEARAVGDNAVAVHAVPALLRRASPSRLLRDITAELARSAGRPFRGQLDLVLATMACHGSIRAGDAVSREEAEALLAALDGVDFAGHCPHGRPLVMRMGWSDLERRVGR